VLEGVKYKELRVNNMEKQLFEKLKPTLDKLLELKPLLEYILKKTKEELRE